MRQKILGLLVAGTMAAAGFAATTTKVPATDAEIAQKIAKEIRMYSRYTIWDNVVMTVANSTRATSFVERASRDAAISAWPCCVPPML